MLSERTSSQKGVALSMAQHRVHVVFVLQRNCPGNSARQCVSHHEEYLGAHAAVNSIDESRKDPFAPASVCTPGRAGWQSLAWVENTCWEAELAGSG